VPLNPFASDRRQFLKTGAVLAAGSSTLFRAAIAHAAEVPNVPLGLQLYSVRDLLPKDWDGTLKHLGQLGYKDVEAAGYFHHSAAEVKSSISGAGLNLVSAHYPLPMLRTQLDDILSYAKQLGTLKYIICSSPAPKDPERIKALPKEQREFGMNLEDWHWVAEQLNAIGEKVHAAGFTFGYHNHFTEFHPTDGVIPYDQIVAKTDPAKVSFEMDCGWVSVGAGLGKAPEYLKKHGSRVIMLHVKDFKPFTPMNQPNHTEPTPVELGKGVIDYKPIFAAAAKYAHIHHIFVEQEAFTVPPFESLKIDADYMHSLGIK
jgi:sugar phosphate isomerase/epimerase